MRLETPINTLGYGYTGYNIAKQLANKIGSKLLIYPIGQPEEELYKDLQQFDWRISENFYNHKTTTLRIFHQFAVHERSCSNYHIGFPIFELDQFTDIEKRSMSQCDKLFVCSEWGKEVMLDNMPRLRDKDVKVVPLGVDRTIFNENNNTSRPQTIFFNCGKWEKRKGHDFLIKAFESAFNKNDNVELWMMCENPFPQSKNEEWNHLYKTSVLADKIRIIPRQKTQKDVYNIMRQVDCGVFPARAEGWNLELLELLACGKHVITTNYSGHTQFANNENSRLINIEKMESAVDNVWFFGQGNWANLGQNQFDQTVDYMREIHQLKLNNNLHLNSQGIVTSKRFSWENTSQEILNEI